MRKPLQSFYDLNMITCLNNLLLLMEGFYEGFKLFLDFPNFFWRNEKDHHSHTCCLTEDMPRKKRDTCEHEQKLTLLSILPYAFNFLITRI